MPSLKWEYLTGYCFYKTTKTPMFGKSEGYWTLQFDKDYSLSEGLEYAGQNGWELVALQKTWEIYGGSGGTYEPSYFYIFKRPTL